MRRREVDKELQSIQLQLDSMGERMVMSATSDGNGLGDKLRILAFRIGCCRAALDTKESANLHPPTPQGQNAQSSTSPVA